LTGSPPAKRFPLARPSMLLPSKPLPPILQSSSSTKTHKISSTEQENGKNRSSYDGGCRKKQELSSEGKGHKASLLDSIGGDMKKGSLGPPLIPPIRKAPSPHVGSAAGSLQSSLQLDCHQSWEMRQTSVYSPFCPALMIQHNVNPTTICPKSRGGGGEEEAELTRTSRQVLCWTWLLIPSVMFVVSFGNCTAWVWILQIFEYCDP
ncbi:hypothetical protein HGM15179_021923, partial [Zosterops borbonicus]